MMEIGTEISHKIRSAIKAKLVELGAYVDEELPDYIMVMVANKKSVSQMRDDLDLFLGGKTEVFTAWLHELLKKLQSIGGEPKEETKHHKHKHRKRHSKDAHDDESTSKYRKEDVASEDSNGSQQHNSSTSPEVQVQKDDRNVYSVNDDSTVLTETPADMTKKWEEVLPNKKEPTEKSNDSPAVKETAAVGSIVEENTITEEEIVPELLVRADTDEFTEELQLEEAKKTAESEKKSQPKPKLSSVEPSRIAVVRKETVIPTKEILESENVTRPATTTLSERRSVIDAQMEQRSVINTQSEKRSVISRLGSKPDSRPRAIASPIRQVSSISADASRRRRGPTSIIGNVINTPEEDDEEEYDPMNPAVGNVASVVKVTARKSSVPKSLQANKSLLMRAVSEAEKSLAMIKPSTSKPSASQVVVRPMRREEQVVDRTNQPGNKQPRLELISKSRQNDIIRKMKYTIDNDEPEPPKYVIRREEVYQPAYITRPLDNRVVEYIPQPVVIIKEEPESSEDDVVEIAPPEVRATPIVLEDSIVADNKDNTVYVRARRTIKERPNPKFVVTLDGIDPEDFDENELESDTSLHLQQTPEIPINKVNPPKIQPFNINLKDSDDEGEVEVEEDVEMTPLKQVKAKERCKFWPACVNGNACQYHHPTQPCKLFPQCKFSDKCLYIHPNCKYDAKCSRPDCPYTHATRRLTPAVGLPQVLAIPHHQVIVSAPSSYHQSLVPSTTSTNKKQCLYYPNCTNMNCPFYHPTPCRFGMACRNRFCTYFHPTPPTKDKLKWSKSTDSIGEKQKIQPSSS